MARQRKVAGRLEKVEWGLRSKMEPAESPAKPLLQALKLRLKAFALEMNSVRFGRVWIFGTLEKQRLQPRERYTIS
jgi:hypothetical protein